MKRRLVASLMAVAVIAPIAPAMAQQAGSCTPQVEQALNVYGLTLAQMQNVVWQGDFFANSRSPEMGGFQFEGRPPSCTAGKLVMNLWRSCQVSSSYFSGDCHVARVDR